MSEGRPWLVQKYGGTSVGKFLPSIVEAITPSYLLTNRLAIVCSARSGKTKALGTTNLLLQAAAEAVTVSPGVSASGTPMSGSFSGSSFGASISSQLARSEVHACLFQSTVDAIQSDHLAAAQAAVPENKPLREQLERDIMEECDRLRDLLQAACILHEVSPRSRDMIMGIGERLSCRIVTASLQNKGIEADLITLDTVVDEIGEDIAALSASQVDDAGYLDQAFYDKLSHTLGEQIRACKGVAVVTGYFGNVPGSLLSQVGRGYTDLCAALCAVGVRAAELQIWKEVDGVFTADPRKVPTARLVPKITPEEAAELTYYGSEVIHPFTMEQAIKKLVPIRIKNVENPAGCGTVIFPETKNSVLEDPFVDGHVEQPEPPYSGANTPNGMPASLTPFAEPPCLPKLPTAVTIKDNVIVLNVHSNRKTISHGFFARIFGTLDRYGVVVDLISTSEVHVSLAMTAEIRPRTLQRLTAELEHVGAVSVLRSMAILSLVGKEMRHMVGVAGRMFSTLGEGNVNIEMISQGANEINISCVIHERAALKALNLIHYSILELSPKPTNMEGGSFGRSFF
ncbi:aspartate kinase [Malassezia vespertilionis]|uniref:aspartate kinase n=1 Tax=Malassezia vespertilionis TaxID=2020962 RepID=A0A2N1JEV4_9BASI|nr:aspartate kinase [Malassezia vespertilionis]PKI85081.1 Hom3p [Malassezia vespertilionis]WFD05874.1 aspartate kinase [Malassezia vespertilionis]